MSAAGVVRLNATIPPSIRIYEQTGPSTDKSRLQKNQTEKLSHEMMQYLRRDAKDFEELRMHFNEDALGGDGLGASSFNDAASQRSGYSCVNSVSGVSVMQSVS